MRARFVDFAHNYRGDSTSNPVADPDPRLQMPIDAAQGRGAAGAAAAEHLAAM